MFVGVVILAGGLRAARGLGRWQRALARRLLGEEISEPEPFSPRPGFFGWLRASLGDRAAWRAVGYFVAKVPLTVFGVWFALSVWVEAFLGIASPLTGATGTARFGRLRPAARPRLPRRVGTGSAAHVGVFVTGVVFLFVAPWTMRLVVYLDRRMMHLLLGPDAAASRVQKPRGVEVEDPRRRHRDPPTHRAQPARRHPGPAGRPGDAARSGQGKARPPRRRGPDR